MGNLSEQNWNFEKCLIRLDEIKNDYPDPENFLRDLRNYEYARSSPHVVQAFLNDRSNGNRIQLDGTWRCCLVAPGPDAFPDFDMCYAASPRFDDGFPEPPGRYDVGWLRIDELPYYDVIPIVAPAGFPPQITLREALGRDGGDHSYAALDRLDSEIVAEINRNRPKEKHILSKVQAGRRNARRAIGKKRPLASEIAHEARNTKVTDDNIESVIRALGYTVTKRTERHISVKFGQGGTVARKRPRRFDLPKLLAEVEAIQMRQSDPGDLNSADKRECASKRPLQGIRGAWESTTMAL